MKSTRYVLLAIGILGSIASIYNYIQGESLSSSLIYFVCSASLIFGFWEFGEKTKQQEGKCDN